jgi:hypothetical protein
MPNATVIPYSFGPHATRPGFLVPKHCGVTLGFGAEFSRCEVCQRKFPTDEVTADLMTANGRGEIAPEIAALAIILTALGFDVEES